MYVKENIINAIIQHILYKAFGNTPPNGSQFTRAFFPMRGRTCLFWPYQHLNLFFSCIPDIAGTSDLWDKLEKNILDDLTPNLQEDYGQDYILKQRSFLKFMSNSSEPDVSPVLLDVQHAISAKSPYAFYTPGKMSFLWLCFASFSPTVLFDYFSKSSHSFTRGMPRALSKANWKNEAM